MTQGSRRFYLQRPCILHTWVPGSYIRWSKQWVPLHCRQRNTTALGYQWRLDHIPVSDTLTQHLSYYVLHKNMSLFVEALYLLMWKDDIGMICIVERFIVFRSLLLSFYVITKLLSQAWVATAYHWYLSRGGVVFLHSIDNWPFYVSLTIPWGRYGIRRDLISA